MADLCFLCSDDDGIQLIWILVKVPETKGVSLEELQKKLAQ